jgi:hypothetical protein
MTQKQISIGFWSNKDPLPVKMTEISIGFWNHPLPWLWFFKISIIQDRECKERSIFFIGFSYVVVFQICYTPQRILKIKTRKNKIIITKMG